MASSEEPAGPPPVLLCVRPPWAWTTLELGRGSVWVCALLPVLAFVASFAWPAAGAEAVFAVAVVGLVLWQRTATPQLRVTSADLELTHHLLPQHRRGGRSRFEPIVTIPLASITDLELCDQPTAAEFMQEPVRIRERARDRGGRRARRRTIDVDVAPFVDYAVPSAAPDQPAALLVASARGSHHRVSMLPVWRPADGPRLLRVTAEAAEQLDEPVAEAAWPGEAETWRRSVGAAVRANRGQLLALLLAATAAIALLTRAAQLVRAGTLDTLLGTAAGSALQFVYRLTFLLGVTLVVAVTFVAALTLVVWTRAGQPVTRDEALQLAWLRAVWAAWQLRVWLAGFALLATVGGVGTHRYVLGYGLASGTIPVVQTAHQLVRRGVEEVRSLRPPPLERVAVAHQWLAAAAAVALYLFWRWY